MFLAGAKLMHPLPLLDCMKVHIIGGRSRIFFYQSYVKLYSFYANTFADCNPFKSAS